jgi:hypothetical protein
MTRLGYARQTTAYVTMMHDRTTGPTTQLSGRTPTRLMLLVNGKSETDTLPSSFGFMTGVGVAVYLRDA